MAACSSPASRTRYVFSPVILSFSFPLSACFPLFLTLTLIHAHVISPAQLPQTPVQKWQTASIQSVRIEKSKHIHIEIGGPGAEPLSLHFHGGSKDVAEAVVAKVETSRAVANSSASAGASSPAPSSPPPPAAAATLPPSALATSKDIIDRPHSAQRSVHFDSGEPEIIPPREPSEAGDSVLEHDLQDLHDEEEQGHDEDPGEGGGTGEEGVGDSVMVLYDFTADGEDELSVQAGESLLVLERDSDEWWKCRNAAGAEGVVPASYVEVCPFPFRIDDESSPFS